MLRKLDNLLTVIFKNCEGDEKSLKLVPHQEQPLEPFQIQLGKSEEVTYHVFPWYKVGVSMEITYCVSLALADLGEHVN